MEVETWKGMTISADKDSSDKGRPDQGRPDQDGPGQGQPDQGPTELEDLRLARRMREGDRRAFEAFFEPASRGLQRYASARLPADPELVHEVVQATLVKGIESLANYRGIGPLMAWFFGICRFEIAAHYRRQEKETSVELIEDDPLLQLGSGPGRVVDPEANPEIGFERRETHRLVHAVLDSLPGSYGDVLEWKYLEGLSVCSIADRLGLSAKAAESQLTRARGAFRRLLPAVREAASGRRAGGAPPSRVRSQHGESSRRSGSSRRGESSRREAHDGS